MKRIVIAIIVCTLMMVPMQAQAKSANRYATKTTAIKEQAARGAKAITKIKRNTRVKVIKDYKNWAMVECKGVTGYVAKSDLHAMKSPKKYKGRKLRRSGVLRWKGYKFTWYSQRILPGRGLKIPGRHVDKQGFVCDRDGYIVIASTRAMRKKRTVVPTPFGKYGKCYDCGGGGSNWRDCYTNF